MGAPGDSRQVTSWAGTGILEDVEKCSENTKVCFVGKNRTGVGGDTGQRKPFLWPKVYFLRINNALKLE